MADNNVSIKQVSTGVTHEIHNVQVGTDGSIPIVDQVVQVSVLPALPAGSNALGSVTISNLPGTQPVSGTVAATQSGAWTNTVTQATGTNLHVVVDSAPTTAVTGTFWQATQPVSAAALPLPTGAATAAKQPALGTAGSASTDVITVQGIAGGTAQLVSGTFFQSTQPVSGTVAIGAGAAAIGSVSVSNFPATQPVSGTVTANIGTTGSLALDTTLTGGTQKAQLIGATGNVAVIDSNGNQQIKGSFIELTGSSSTTGTNIIASTDVSAYKFVSVQTTGTWTGVVNIQFCNDGLTFASANFNGGTSAQITANGLFYVPVLGRYMQIRATTVSSGTVNVIAELYTIAPVTVSNGALSVLASQSGTWTVGLSAGSTVQPGNTPNTTPWLVNSLLNPTGTLLNTYSVHLTSNATTTPTASTAYISSVAISSEVGGTTSTVTIQDKQGTPLKLINGFSTTALTTTPTVVNFQTPVKMVSGIDVITAGAVAATIDVWINYYQ